MKFVKIYFPKDFLKLGNYGSFKSPYHFWLFFNDTLNHNLRQAIIHMNFEEGTLNQKIITNKVMNPFFNLIYMDCSIKCPIFKKKFIWSIQTI